MRPLDVAQNALDCRKTVVRAFLQRWDGCCNTWSESCAVGKASEKCMSDNGWGPPTRPYRS